MIYEIAESQMFNILGSQLTPLECAGQADLYQAFFYLAQTKAKYRVQNPQTIGL